MEQRDFTVTLIGDDPAAFNMFEISFSELKQSLSFTRAITGEALEALRAGKPAMVFIHLDEKPRDVLQLLSVIKSDNRLRSIRVFLYGNLIDEEVCKMARMLGASGCIERTTCKTTFMRELRAILDPRLLPDYVFMAHASNGSPAMTQNRWSLGSGQHTGDVSAMIAGANS